MVGDRITGATAKVRGDGRPWHKANEDAHRNLNWFLSMSAALTTLLSYPAGAAKWEVIPTLSVGETYTDNLALAPDDIKQSDWITEVIPGITVIGTGERLKFKATYEPQVLYYANGQNNNQILQRGNAAGTAEVAKDILFLDAGANAAQYDASLQSPITQDNVNATGNRTTIATYYVSPYVKREFGNVQGEARVTGTVVNSDNQALFPNSTGERVDLSLKSGAGFKLLTWKVAYSGDATDYDSGEYSSSQIVTADVKRLITPTIGLLAQVGYEDYKSEFNDVDISPGLGGGSYSGGFDWTPSPRTHLSATIGHRFYGKAYSFDFAHRSRLTTWGLSYTEGVTTTRGALLIPSTSSTAGYLDTLFTSQYPDPVARQRAVQDFIARTGLPPALGAPVNFLSTQQFVEKSWQGYAGILGIRNVLMFNGFRGTREALVGDVVLPTSGDFAASRSIRQTGVGALWNLRLTSQNSMNVRASYARNELLGTDEVDNLTYYGLGFSRQFEPKLTGSLNYRRQHSDSNVMASYTENAVVAAFQMRF